jgi:hypothetical protein
MQQLSTSFFYPYQNLGDFNINQPTNRNIFEEEMELLPSLSSCSINQGIIEQHNQLHNKCRFILMDDMDNCIQQKISFR